MTLWAPRRLARIEQIAQQLLSTGVVPSRVAYGLDLAEGERRANFLPYLEVWNGSSWTWYNPVSGDRVRPESLFIWWRGGRPLINVLGAGNPEVEISTWRNVLQALEVAERRAELKHSSVVDYSLLRLPLQVQAVYKVMLLVPVGAFLIVILRNVIGILTLGTFMPVLVALAFRETRLMAGVILFALVVGAGIGLRFLLDRLHLLVVPRLSAVLVLVVLGLLMVSILSHRLGLEVGLSVALFPLVILTMTIERMSIVWEEVGAKEATKQGLGTLLVAAIAYEVMSLDAVEYVVVVFPESLLILLALILLLGRYTGYRLLELVRYKDLIRSDD
ncbi:MAG: 7TM domain-containing protein [Acidobacteriota bacterium]